MGLIYLAAMIVGAGIIGLQLFMSSDDADAGAHGDLDAHADLDAHGDLDAHADLDADADLDGDADVHAGPGAEHALVHADGAAAKLDLGGIAIFLSLRFWTFALMSFGLLGCFLHYLKLASPLATGISSTLLGISSGLLAAYTFRALARSNLNSGASSNELVGQVGKVLLPPNTHGRAKIRLRVKGQMIDYVATSDEQLEPGASVLVEEVRGERLHVSPAPSGLKYGD